MIRNMAYHYRTQNTFCNMRVKKMKGRLRQTLKGKKEEDRLRILIEASLAHQDTSLWCFSPILGKFGRIFVTCNFWNFTHRKSASTRNATGTALFLGAPNREMVWIFVLKLMRTCTLWILYVFWAELVHQKVKKHPKHDLSTTFWTHRSSIGRINVWG